MVGCQKFVQYIMRMLYPGPGRFVLIESVYPNMSKITVIRSYEETITLFRPHFAPRPVTIKSNPSVSGSPP